MTEFEIANIMVILDERFSELLKGNAPEADPLSLVKLFELSLLLNGEGHLHKTKLFFE